MSIGTASAALAGWASTGVSEAATPSERSSLMFVTGTDRRIMIKKVLEPFIEDMKKEIGDRNLIVKVNMADKIDLLSNTHPDALRGLLDIVSSFYKKRITIAECTLSKETFPVLCGNYGYHPLASEYPVDFVELHDGPSSPMFILGKHLKPQHIEILDVFTNPDNFIVSITPPKIHDVVVVTAGLKNIVMASPKNIENVSSKYSMHGNGPWWLNYNLFTIAQKVHPHFTIIDGREGMEGNGPIHGTKVDHNFALAGWDVIAVDRIVLDLMGVDLADVGYLTYCGEGGLGVIDRERIAFLGNDSPSNHDIPYKKHKAFKYQQYWKKDVAIEGWNPKDLPY